MSEVTPIPEGFHTTTVALVVDDGAAALAFYSKAFGGQERFRMPMPDGKIMHAEIQIGDSVVFVYDEFPGMGVESPKSIGGTASSTHLYVEDVDASFAKAVDAGCEVLMPVMDMFWGDRFCKVKDPFGHVWTIATHTVDLTPEQIAKGAAECCKDMSCE